MFMLAFIGATLLCLALGVWGGLHLDETRGKLALAGAVLYVVGGFVVTMVANVPLNNALAQATPGAAAWHDFYSAWLTWNHVRTAASVAATVLLLLAIQSG
jgi:uncharacterized membrane protein